ncbi:MAG: AraC family transcriptional regulator [Polyangiales bacterium]
MGGTGTSSARAVGPLLAALAARGHGRVEVAHRVGLPAEAFDEEGPGLDVEAMRRLWQLGAELLSDVRLGLHLGQHVSRDTFDLVSYLASSSATLEEALRRIERYLRLLTASVDYELSREGETARWSMRPRGGDVEPIRAADEFSITARIAYMRQWLGREFRPRSVSFRHRLEQGEDVAEYERLYGCPVRFGAPVVGFEFAASELDEPLVGADPSLGRILSRYADEALANRPAAEDFTSRVREALVQGLEAGDVRVGAVAKKLATSERSLQRHLRDEGTSFADLLDDVRRDLALRYLRDAALSVSEVAYMLGYSEKATFFRAFRKWTGETPGAYRAKGERARGAKSR